MNTTIGGPTTGHIDAQWAELPAADPERQETSPLIEPEAELSIDSAVADALAPHEARQEPISGEVGDRGEVGDQRNKVKVLLLSDVEPERVAWLWKGRIPLGKITILEGDPGLGKSTVLLDIAARLSRGDGMPSGDDDE